MRDAAPMPRRSRLHEAAIGLDALDTHVAVQAAVKADGIGRYYIDNHMNDAGNGLPAALLVRHLKNGR